MTGDAGGRWATERRGLYTTRIGYSRAPMRTTSVIFGLLGVLVGCASQRPNNEAPSVTAISATDVRVMVLGSYHMGGSTSDVINVESDSVLTEDRQAELKRVADALAAFKPTVVFTERVTEAPNYVDPKYETFTNDMLGRMQDERVQLAYRVAKRAGVTRVHGIDEQPSDGEPDYFPFGRLVAHAAETGQKVSLDRIIQRAKKMTEAFSANARGASIARTLIEIQRGPMSSADMYYEIAALDIGEAQPAAELQGYWFMRNAKIWSKLRDIVKPGDRAIVVFGAGHKFWLDHLARHSPGFVEVDPVPFLEAADRR